MLADVKRSISTAYLLSHRTDNWLWPYVNVNYTQRQLSGEHEPTHSAIQFTQNSYVTWTQVENWVLVLSRSQTCLFLKYTGIRHKMIKIVDRHDK